MPKMKIHKGLKKRVRVSASGKIVYRQPNAAHLMSAKSGSRRRRLRKPAKLEGVLAYRIRVAMGAG